MGFQDSLSTRRWYTPHNFNRDWHSQEKIHDFSVRSNGRGDDAYDGRTVLRGSGENRSGEGRGTRNSWQALRASRESGDHPMGLARRRRETQAGREFRRHRGSGDSSSRSEEHTSELQSLAYLVCRLLLEKKTTTNSPYTID